jgi:hypothetical protein
VVRLSEPQSLETNLPQVSSIAGYVGGFACVLNFGDIPPGIGLAAVDIDVFMAGSLIVLSLCLGNAAVIDMSTTLRATPNGMRLSCSAIMEDPFHNLRAAPSSSTC